MARHERVLALDIGATNIKAGEFEYSPGGVITLVGFAVKEHAEELNDTNRSAIISSLVGEMIRENNFKARKALISISGQSALIRFVPLPPVSEEEKRIRQIVEFEARQNVPFPLEEVIWDYQLIANPEAAEMEVMFVVIKSDIIEQVTQALQSLSLKPCLVDVAPVACYNAARANHIGDDECVMILNIGGRSCNLLFVDRTRFFARTIPIAGHAITQQIAKEFNIGLAEAEELKRRHGFVALGGAYEAPESEVAATISKIVRSVMTRLHGEINRSINVYRAQQKGNKPIRLYLAGGSSIMAFTDRFFNETLHMDVAYLNPFQVVAIGESVNRQQLQEVAHMFSEIVGLGLRYRVQCPVEVSLIPDSIRRQQTFDQKKPYLAGALSAVVLMVGVGAAGQNWLTKQYQAMYSDFEGSARSLAKSKRFIADETAAADASQAKYTKISSLLEQRFWIPGLLNEVQRVKPEGVWINSLRPLLGELKEIAAGGGGGNGGDAGAASNAGGAPPMGMGMPGGFNPMGFPGAGGGGGGGGAASGTSTGVVQFKITGIEIQGHGVLVKTTKAKGAKPPAGETNPAEKQPEDGADAAPAGTPESEEPKAVDVAPDSPELLFLEQLRKSPVFEGDPKWTGILNYQLSENVRNLGNFTLQVKLKQPIDINRE